MPRDMWWKQLMHILGEINGAYHDASVKMGLADSEMQILYSVHMAEGKLYLETGAGRSRSVRLTQAGEELCRERVAPVAAAEEAIWNGWTEADRDAYLRLSRQYLEDLRARVEALRGPQNGGRA